MDFYDATKILSDRIQKLEPENALKIVRYLLLQGIEKDFIRLAHSPDKVIEEKVQEAKLRLATIQACEHSLRYPLITTSPRPYSSPIPITPNPYWNRHLGGTDHQQVLNPDYAYLGFQDIAEDYTRLSNQAGQFLSFEDQLEVVASGGMVGLHGEFYYSDSPAGGVSGRISRQSTPSLPSFPNKTCHYFNKGFCKHGSNCRYLHGVSHSLPDNLSRIFAPHSIDGSVEDHAFSSGSLEKLEAEITELLKSRRGNPVSIASLPMMYQEKYSRSLQAEGYLTESQRHGRAGYSLTKLLARLKNVRLFERPHGQHFVILAEDAAKYCLESHNERKDPGPVVAGSRQIYLTFPAESTFSEEDVSNYFSSFGPVEDVRIPCQQKRMFGFVTFSCPNTVKMVLAKGNPHFVCGARVLVKPYREKSKLVERKYTEKAEQCMHQYYQANYWDLEPEIHPMPRGSEPPRFLRRQIMEEQERALELETRHLSELKLVQKPVSALPYLNYAMEELNASEDQAKFPSAEQRLDVFLMDVLNNGSTNDDPTRQAEGSYSDQESFASLSSGNQAINLPDSPFAPQIPSSISTVI